MQGQNVESARPASAALIVPGFSKVRISYRNSTKIKKCSNTPKCIKTYFGASGIPVILVVMAVVSPMVCMVL